MRSKTVTELHQAFLTRGGFANSSVWTFSNFIELLNTAVAEVWRLLADSFEDYYLVEDTSIETTPDTDYVTLPNDFWRLRLVEVSRSTPGADEQDYQPLTRVGLMAFNRARKLSGEPTKYHLRGTVIEGEEGAVMQPWLFLAPIPSAARTVRITYVPAPPVFDTTEPGDDEDAESWDGIAGYEKLVIEHCLYDAYKRSKMPTVECAQEIARLTEELKASAPNRDAFKTETIADHVTGPGLTEGWSDEEPL